MKKGEVFLKINQKPLVGTSVLQSKVTPTRKPLSLTNMKAERASFRIMSRLPLGTREQQSKGIQLHKTISLQNTDKGRVLHKTQMRRRVGTNWPQNRVSHKVNLALQ
jgi:hypothetical protein